jgi:predicted GNAT family N-acyltransferase
MADPEISIELGSWSALRALAEPIRTSVFVDEQNVPAEIEVDDWDAVSLHAIARDAAGAALGTGRLLPDGHIGRMAVLRAARGRGVGRALLRALVQAARERGHREVVLSAQMHALAFYQGEGFVGEGEVYDDAGIPHLLMRLRL